MEIILNKENMLLQDYNINEITIETSTTNPTIDIEFFESHPFIKDKITPAHITYEKKLFTTSVSYQRDLTPKSGIEIHFNKAQNGIITEGYIDFYTIKKSTSKRNGIYRLIFIDGNFDLYLNISRKYNYGRRISGYKVEGELTPDKLNVVISRMIQIINKHAKSHNKQDITDRTTDFFTINEILNLERDIIDKIKKKLNYQLSLLKKKKS